MKLGIIITCYNNQNVIEACIDSVMKVKALALVSSNIRLFVTVIDDASTDNSFHFLRRFKKRNQLDVCVQNRVNKGVSFSRNKGISYCKNTDYITFIDADDTINKQLIYALNKVLWADLVLFNFSHYHSGTGALNQKLFFSSDLTLTKHDILRYLTAYYEQPNNFSMLTTCWGKFFKTTSLHHPKPIRFKERLHLCEDTEFVHQFLVKQSGGIQFINKSFYTHTIASGNDNFKKATFGSYVPLSNQLNFVRAVIALKPYMVASGTDNKKLKEQMLHCLGAYIIIYSIRSCAQVRTISDFRRVRSFWKKAYNKPVLRKAMSNYSPKRAHGNIILPFLIRNKFYLSATLLSLLLCRKRYFSKLT